jgi:N-acetylated-alpha-linked acidic dipeptidase
MKQLNALAAGLLCAALPLMAAQPALTPPQSMAIVPPEAPMLGYSTTAAIEQRGWEQRFREGVSQDAIRENMRRLSARPHHVGSPYDKDNAEWMLARFREWGFDAKIETFNVLFPTPKARLLEMLAPHRYRASLTEPRFEVDPGSQQGAEQLPTYNAYSADGDVTAPLVYVNYGNRDDYEQLERLGVSVKGAIVIARYGHGWRGIKPKVAAEHGAVGCIIYSDPKGDGYYEGDTFPGGGNRAQGGVQRGSVMDTEYPGDPLTPGVAATADAKRLDLKDARTLTRIPVLPISYTDALPLLSALAGPVAPSDWRGALAITYHIGPGPARVHLKVASNWDIKPIYDVIATLKGSQLPDQWVIRGNHHDAWVNGAEDPISGQSAMLEEARQLGALHRQGWNPRRTVIYCAWDGEEPGLLGSVEWVEAHVQELRAHAVSYINSDSNDRGFLDASGTQDLQKFVSGVAREIADPETGMSAYQRAHLRAIAVAKNAEERAGLRGRSDLVLEMLGDGSDFTAFQDYAGIPTMSIEYGGEDDGSQYHSIYDDFYWFTHFVDTDFAYGQALSRTAGTAMMRLADAEVIPLDFAPQAEALEHYVSALETLLKDKQEEYAERNRQLGEGVFRATSDPRRPVLPPKLEAVPPYMSFAPLKNAVTQFRQSADRYAKALASLEARGAQALPAESQLAVNAKLMSVSRLFLDEQGLPERPWFKNMVYAPGAYTGYEASPLAAVREYMDSKQWQEADAQVPRIARSVSNAAAGVAEAAATLEQALAVH